MPFVVLSLPRSRSAWLSRFLTYRDWVCGHEELRHMRCLEDIKTWFAQPCIGTAETAAAPWWRLLPSVAPDCKIVVVRRPVDEVIESLRRIPGLRFDLDRLAPAMRRLDHKLGQIEKRVPNVLSVGFSDLEREDSCASVFEHCLPHRHDSAHWATLAPINMQINMPALVRYYQAYEPALTKLAHIAKHRTVALMSERERHSLDGLTYQTEAFDDWRRDGQKLFKEHCVIVGEDPNDWERKNWPLMRTLHEAGSLQIMSARCNGRMFGYLVSILSPSLASPDLLTASHTTFFASPDFPGLGLKLQRAALKPLRERGVGEIFMQAGLRGSGERIASIYKRMGAENNGQFFRLDLKEAC